MSKAVDIIDGVLFVHTRHYDDVNRVIICHQKKPYRVFSDDEKKEWSRPHGEWIEKEDYNMDTYYDCSVCGNSWCTFDGTPWQNRMNFCPKCGADMREGDGE